MTVSVVIPTQGRPSVQLAVRSAAEQDDVDVEVIVVDASGSGAAESYARQATVYIRSDSPLSPGAARQVGCDAASGEWIAFLDDDDLSRPGRLARQIAVASASRLKNPVVSSDYLSAPYNSVMKWGYEEAVRRADNWPDTLANSFKRGPYLKPQPGQGLAEYLLRRRRLRRRASVHTSTLLVERSVALNVPWNPILSSEDWDWLVRAENWGAPWLHVAEPLTIVSSDSPNSQSTKPRDGPRALDVAWPIAALFPTKRRELGDLLVSDIAVCFLKEGRIRDGLAAWKLGYTVGRAGPRAHARCVLSFLHASWRSLTLTT
jgi:glycosyltransferase involved in cell wall biosynthesis